jgi:dihydrolipoamide dehydrogenase
MGLIGLELGQAMHHMGLEVTGVDQRDHIGGLQDPEINRVAVKSFSAEMPLFLGTKARIEKNRARLRITAGEQVFEADKMLLSVGRVPNLAGLQLERLGVELDDDGLPSFNCHTMQVGDLPVFIAGDVANDRPVLHEVDHEGTVAGYNAVHRPVRRFKRKTPLMICFTEPNICVAGAPWDAVKDKDPAVGGATFQGGRERIMQRTGGMIRIYADRKEGRLLGSEMAAPHGEHLAHLLAWSIQQNRTVFDLLAMPFYHPTVEEGLQGALKNLAEQVDNRLDGPMGLEPE